MTRFQLQKRDDETAAPARFGTGMLKANTAAPADSLRVVAKLCAQPAGMLKPLLARTVSWMLRIGRGIHTFLRPCRGSGNYCARYGKQKQVRGIAEQTRLKTVPSHFLPRTRQAAPEFMTRIRVCLQAYCKCRMAQHAFRRRDSICDFFRNLTNAIFRARDQAK